MATARVLAQKTELQKVTECPLCLRQLENPQRLQQCFHSFCQECLNEVMKTTGGDDQSAKCPVCETPVVPTDISENNFLKELVCSVESKELSSEIKCKQCYGNPNVANVRCIECKLELCANCKVCHLKVPFLSDHTFTDLKDEPDKVVDRLHTCGRHGNPFEFCCNDCDELICVKCNDDHPGHFTESLKVTERKLREEINGVTPKMLKYCEVLRKNVVAIQKKIDESNKSFEGSKAFLETQLELLIKEITIIKDKMKLEVSKQQAEGIGILEETKHGLECKIAKGEHLQNVVCVTLKHAKCLSLIQEIQSGLVSAVKNCIDSKIEEPSYLHMPVPKLPILDDNTLRKQLDQLSCELKSCTHRRDIRSCGHLVQVNPVTSYMDIFEKRLVKRVQINELKFCYRLSYINGKIWIPQGQQVNIYTNDGVLERVLNLDRHVFSVKIAANDNLIFSGENGLHYRTSENENDIQIIKEPVRDIACCGFVVAAYKYLSKAIEIYELSLGFVWESNQWNLKHSFQVAECRDHFTDTIMLTENYVYICFNGTPNVQKYTHNGRRVFLEFCKMDGCSLFCGCDRSGNLLLCGYDEHDLKVITDECKPMQSVTLSGECKSPLGVIVDSDSKVWVLQHRHSDSSYYLTKFS